MTRGVMRRLAPLALAAPALLAGCESGVTTGPRIVSLAAVSGLGQSGIVGAELAQPLLVRAVDQNQNPVVGVIIDWTVVSGGGQVTPSQSTTGSDGLAQATFRLGNLVGVQSVQAELSGAQPVIFTATASTAPASQIAVAGGDNQAGAIGTTLPVQIAVKVSDAFNNPKAGITVSFAVTLGGGTLSSATAASGADGIASVEWTLGSTAGTQRVSATVVGIPSVSFNATATAAPAAKLVIVGGNNQSAPPGARLADSLVVRVTDQFDNPVADVVVAWSTVGDAGQVSPTSSRTDAGGRAATSWTLGATGGPKTVRATVGNLAPAEFRAAGTIVFVSVSAGGLHSCGLDEGGVAYCWGFDGEGQLGLGEEAQGSGPVFASPQPTAVTGALTFAALSSGGFHTCGVALSFNPYCWGKNVDGRLGDGTRAVANAPAHVDGPFTFREMRAGGAQTCALTIPGRLYCWGSNAEGQVGVGSTDPQFSTPMEVMAGTIFSFTAVGGLHACAISGADTRCWGLNASGQLGDGSGTGSASPVLVTTALTFTRITAGGQHTCALTAAGAAWCWGANQDGQLGDGTTTNSAVPVAVTGAPAFASISAGEAHTCGVTPAGVAFCWGRNVHGQLGDGSTVSTQAPVAVGGGLSFASISAGQKHSCGVTTGRVAYCWGDNQFGQLGDETQLGRLLPTKVSFQP